MCCRSSQTFFVNKKAQMKKMKKAAVLLCVHELRFPFYSVPIYGIM